MKLRFVSISLLVVLAAVASWYVLYPKISPPKIRIEQLVPPEALLLIEFGSSRYFKDQSTESTVNLSLELLSKIKLKIGQMETWARSQGFLTLQKDLQIITETGFYVSVHAGANSFKEEVIYLELHRQDQSLLVSEWLKKFAEDKSLLISKRKYQEIEIYEVKKSNRKIFHFLFLKQWLIGSENSFLLEDIIRNYKSDQPVSYEISKVESSVEPFDGIKIHLNLQKAYDLLKKEAKSVPGTWFGIEQYAMPVFLEGKPYKNTVLWAGFGANDHKTSLSKYLGDNLPKETTLWPYMPVDAKQIHIWTFNSGVELYQQLNSADSASVYPIRSLWNELTQSYRLSPQVFYEAIKGELAYVELKPAEENDLSVAVLIKVKTDEMIGALKKLEEYIPDKDSDSSENELYKNHEIHLVEIEQLPQKLFGPAFAGFQISYWCLHKDVLIIANSSGTIKSLIDCQDSEANWSRDTYFKNEVIDLLGSFNFFSFYSSAQLSQLFQDQPDSSFWGSIKKSLPKELSVPYLLMTFSNETSTHQYISLYIPFEKASTTKNIQLETAPSALEFSSPVLSGPNWFKLKDKSGEVIMVEDSSHALKLIENGGTLHWERRMSAGLARSPIAVHKKGNGEFLISLQSQQLHWVDYEGNFTDTLIKLPSGTIASRLELIDYDQSGNYRISLHGDKSELYLLDLKGQALEGWNPKKLDEKAVGPVKSVRVKGKDYLVCLTVNGGLYLFNRKGEKINGFPIQLEGRFSQMPVLRAGSDEEHSTVNFINDLGVFYRITLNGKDLLRKNLPRAGKESRFIQLRNTESLAWSFLQLSPKGIEWYDEKGNPIYAEELLVSETITTRFAKIDQQLILTIGDEATHKTELFIYTGKGNVIRKTIEGTHADLLVDRKTKSLIVLTRDFQKLQRFSYSLP